MTIRVLHLNASEKGGASIVAQRLNTALNEHTDIQSKHLIFSGNINGLSQTYTWADTPWKKIRAGLNHALDKLDFLQFEREAKIRFQFNHARIGVDISEHPLVLEADILHLHWVLKGFLSFETLKKLFLLGKPIVWTCHDLWPFTGGCFYLHGCERNSLGCGDCPYLIHPGPNDSSVNWLKQKRKIFQLNPPSWIAPSAWLANEINTSMVLEVTDPISVIPNAIKVANYKPVRLIEKKKLKSKFGLSTTTFTLLFVAANLENPAKGFRDFVLICDALKDLPVQALVVGKSSVPVELAVRNKWLGYVNDPVLMQEIFGASDVYITTSYEDNLPTTVMESLAMAIPALGYNIGGIPELITHDSTGYVFSEGEWNDMALFIRSNMNESVLFDRWSANARVKAEETYDEKIVAHQYYEHYQHVIKKKS